MNSTEQNIGLYIKNPRGPRGREGLKQMGIFNRSKPVSGPQKTRTYIEVEQLLAENATSHQSGVSPRDSDNELFIQVLQRHRGANLSREQLDIIRSVKYESISRARRKLQAEGKYLPSPEVARHRRIKGAELQQTAPTESAAGVQRRIEENS